MSGRKGWVAGPTMNVIDLHSKAVLPAGVMTCRNHRPLIRKTAAGIRAEQGTKKLMKDRERKDQSIKLAKEPTNSDTWAEKSQRNITDPPTEKTQQTKKTKQIKQTKKPKETEETKKTKETEETKKPKTREGTAETGDDRAEEHDHNLIRVTGSGLACRACKSRHQQCDIQIPVCTNCRAENTQDLCIYDLLQQLRQAGCCFMVGARQVVAENGRLTAKYTLPSTAGPRLQREKWARKKTAYRRKRVPAGSRKEGQHSNGNESMQFQQSDTSLKSNSKTPPSVNRIGTRGMAGLGLGSRLRDETEIVPAGGRKKRRRSDESESTRPMKSKKGHASLDSRSDYVPSPPEDEASSEFMPTDFGSTENEPELQKSQEDISMSDAL
ncbi:MAG: hypothetical protein Q9170_001466 [Blastenia crenularia]